ncbi:uncharacterized protein DS421_1g15580 [Arachis hypogaea]|nr:uncharacterized protein DS421_1g15580 [Arachis hypogaea]
MDNQSLQNTCNLCPIRRCRSTLGGGWQPYQGGRAAMPKISHTHKTRYFLAEFEGPEQKFDLETDKGLQMLLDSDLPALDMDFMELQNSK